MRPIVLTLLLTLLLTACRGLAGTTEISQTPAQPPTELTLSNFFSAGWDQPYSFRTSLPDGAPDLPLFTLVTNFLARVSRTDYFYETELGKSPTKDVQFLDEYVDYAFNQRVMLSVFGNYTELDQRDSRYEAGRAAGGQLRFQLVDTQTDSDALNFRVDSPDQGLGNHSTKISSSITGWRDLSQLGVGRNVIMLGVDFPLTHPSDTRNVFRLTYIYCY